MRKMVLSLLISLFFLPFSLHAQTKDYGDYDAELGSAIQGLGKKYALVIGINDYPGRSLDYAVRDARVIGKLLRDRYGFDVEELTLPGNTTRTAIVDAFDRLVDKVEMNDQVIIFFSGHGDVRKRGKQITGGYLVPINGVKGKSATLIRMDYIPRLSRDLVARHVLFIIDTCYSALARGMSHMGTAPEETIGFVKAKMDQRGRQVMTAGKSGQRAWMLNDLKMSVFSYYLKQALEGKADGNKDHVVTLSEVQSYVEKKVSVRTNNKQEPVWRHLEDTGDAGEFVFVPKDFEDWAHKQKRFRPSVIPLPDGRSEPGRPLVAPLPDRPVELKGNGGIYVNARPDGVTAEVITPSGKRYEKTTCPVTLKDLPAGTYLLRLSKPLYHTKELPLKVGLGIVSESVTLHPNFGWLTVTSDPSGASVHLDGVYVGTTPVIRKQKKSGPYDLKVALPRFHDHKDEVIIADERTREVNVKLKPAFGTLVIDSTPSGADVWIDGEKAGTTPFNKELTSARYLVSIKKALYDPVLDQRITVSDGRTMEKTYRLRADFGNLKVNSTPSGADVWVDGKRLGTTPWDMTLKPGNYRVKVEKDASRWAPRKYKVLVVREKTVSIKADLPRKRGGLNVYVEPAVGDVEVFLESDNHSRGKAPCTISDLGTGEVTVICRGKRDGESVVGEKRVMVEWGKVKSVTVPIEFESPIYGDKLVVSSINYEMVYIKPGTFMMGSPPLEGDRDEDEGPQHQVTLTKGFYMGVTEVTQGQWRKVMGRNNSALLDNRIFENCGDGCPMWGVNRNECQIFIRKLNQMERMKGEYVYRLPTEAQWEYAARAGSTTRFSFGDNDYSLGEYGWYKRNSDDSPHPVKLKRPNEWGLYDMHGNVKEWCLDWMANYVPGPATDPTGPSKSNSWVNRGGSFRLDADNCRSANRDRDVYRGNDLGFRLVLDLRNARKVQRLPGPLVAFPDGIVKDTASGLEWKGGPDKDMTWHHAVAWVKSVDINGGRWRLPTMDELEGLYQRGVGPRNITSSLKTSVWWVWSGESVGDSWANYYDFYGGNRSSAQQGGQYGIRAFAVRSRKAEVKVKNGGVETVRVKLQKGPAVIEQDGSYVLFENGIVRDNSTGLEWYVPFDVNFSWERAQKAVQLLSLDGGGWRMPTENELRSLYIWGKGLRNMTPLFKKNTGWLVWTSETTGSPDAFFFNFRKNCGLWRRGGARSGRARAFVVRSRSDE